MNKRNVATFRNANFRQQ